MKRYVPALGGPEERLHFSCMLSAIHLIVWVSGTCVKCLLAVPTLHGHMQWPAWPWVQRQFRGIGSPCCEFTALGVQRRTCRLLCCMPSDDEKHCLSIDSRLIRRLKAHEHGLYNCVCSILADQNFIREICQLYPLPTFANLRCGLWYLPDAQQSCYFKSTDGHTGNWAFSTTRLNLHVAFEAARHGGCVLVDATKKGKVFPDAFSKTVPIWAAVVNQAVVQLSQRLPSPAHLPHTRDWDTDVHLPSWVADSEKQQIASKLDSWITQLQQSGARLDGLAATLIKPLRCLWVSQHSRIWLNQVTEARELPFTPIILASASDPSAAQTHRSLRIGTSTPESIRFQYVPGAGDDEETWGCGLTADMLHEHQQELVAAGPQGIHAHVKALLASQAPTALPRSRRQDAVSWVQESGLGLADVAAVLKEQQAGLLTAQDCIIDCSHPPVAWSSPATDTAPQAVVMPFPVPAHKQDKQGLLKQLPSIIQAAGAALTGGGRVILCDRSGEDACVCACIALLHLLKLPAGTKSAPTGSDTQGAAALVELHAALGARPAAVCDKQGSCTTGRVAGATRESSSQPCSFSSADGQRSAPVTARDGEVGHLLQSAGACDRYRARQLLVVISMSHSQARVSRGMMKQVTEYFSSRPFPA